MQVGVGWDEEAVGTLGGPVGAMEGLSRGTPNLLGALDLSSYLGSEFSSSFHFSFYFYFFMKDLKQKLEKH